jgi:Na+/H+-dicarboxylate symporter
LSRSEPPRRPQFGGRSSGGVRLAVGFVLGAAAGVWLGPDARWLQPLADVFVVGLTALGPPLAVLALISALASFREQQLGSLALAGLNGFLLSALAAAAIGVTCATILRVGDGIDLARVPPARGDADSVAPYIAQLSAWIRGPYLYCAIAVVFAVLLLRRAGTGRNTATAWLGAAVETTYRMVAWLMAYAPAGVFALVALTFSRQRFDAAASMAAVLAAVYAGQWLVVAGCLLALRLSGHAPAGLLRDAREALLTAFVTGSSAATIALEFEVAEQRFGVPRAPLGVLLSLGFAIHKLGTAVQQAVILVFAAHVAGGLAGYTGAASLTLLALAASIITPPISGGSWIALGVVANLAGLPTESMVVAIAIPLLGKFNTPVNSLGRLTGVCMLAAPPGSAFTRDARE